MGVVSSHSGRAWALALAVAAQSVWSYCWPAQSAAQPSVEGQWAPTFDWPNVAIHVHVLPNGKVLFWGRREWNADGTPTKSLHPQNCTPRIWDPAANTFSVVPQPGYNLFCSGHAFLPDGKLLVVGGHIADSSGKKSATIFNPASNAWEHIADMNAGRWYPTAVTLADGAILVSGGQKKDGGLNKDQQIWRSGSWLPMVEHTTLPLYPRMHLSHDGRVFLSGHLQQTQLLDTTGAGDWDVVGNSAGQLREEGCSVMYDTGKVLIVGGGRPPQKTAEIINLNDASPVWQGTDSMSVERRHHNATILPDGTVLVTGGTSGHGGFNDLTKPVKKAENWDPKTGDWTTWASESVPRLYHSTAVLLPDARVLSAGGGEFALETDPNQANHPEDSHRNAQIFSPPYLFRSTAAKPRPDIVSAPDHVGYGQMFDVATSHPDQVDKITLVRLSSVTHSSNMNQRFNKLTFTVNDGVINVTAPANGKVCPPGHYMLFVLNDDKVPSIAKIIRVHD